jgi:hypothetical protein
MFRGANENEREPTIVSARVDAGHERTAAAMAFALNAVSCGPAVAWGDEGHEIIALIAKPISTPPPAWDLRALIPLSETGVTGTRPRQQKGRG